MSHNCFGAARALGGLAVACALMILAVILAAPVSAADVVFPTGSRLGLVPPAGMIPSDRFDGFTDPDKDAAILITALPATAYGQIEKTLDLEALQKQGVRLEKREPMTLSFGKGFLLIGRQVADKTKYRKWLLVAPSADLTALITVQAPENDAVYSDRAVRAALATVTIRDRVPETEEFALLPFSVGDMAGFHADDFLRGRAVMLTDTPEDATKEAKANALDAHLLIAAIPGGPAEPDQRANFAKLSFGEIGGIKDVNVTISEPLRIGGQSGYQTMAQAKDVRTGADVMVVQWLRFGGGGYLQMIGVARTDSWTATLARLRTVRDSVELK
jgi:hypothetical protein